MRIVAAGRACESDVVGRRAFFAAVVVWASVVLASGAARRPDRAGRRHGRRAVVLPGADRDEPRPNEARFREGLREAGYVEGKNILLERALCRRQRRSAGGDGRGAGRLKVDVILAGGQPAREAARKATTTIPIVTLSGSDPVREGWAQSLAQPGGNVTGLTFTFPELGRRSASSC